MNKFLPTHFEGTRAYFADADPSTQQCYGIEQIELELKVKLWLLLFDHVIVSTKHMIESDLTFAWLERDRNAVTDLGFDGALIPSLRNDRDGFTDWLVRHPVLLAESQNTPPRREILCSRANLLDDTFQTAITWSPLSESFWLKRSIIDDLQRQESPLRKRLQAISSADICQMIEELARIEAPTRRDIHRLASLYLPTQIRIFRAYTDVYYHFSGALEKCAFPLLHHREAALCREKMLEDMHENDLAADQDLWREILAVWQINDRVLAALPLSSLRDIRKDVLGQRVRKTWSKVLHSSWTAPSFGDILYEHTVARAEVLKEFGKQVASQTLRQQAWKRRRKSIEVGVWATGGLSTLLSAISAHPIVMPVGIATGLLGFLAGGVVLDHVEARLPGRELVLLSAQMATNIS